jgi:hypothetical protein
MRMRVDGAVAQGYTVELMARPYAQAWRKVASGVTDTRGQIHIDRAPRVKTLYRWHFAGSESAAPFDSNIVTIRVATKVTLALADSSIRSDGTYRIARTMTGGALVFVTVPAATGNAKGQSVNRQLTVD